MGFFRLILALSVVALHIGFASQWFDPQIAVKFFFVVSGFYMAMVLDGKYPPTRDGVRAFYTNRLLRLYPTYLVALTLGLAAAVLVRNLPGTQYDGFFAHYGAAGAWSLVAVLVQLLIVGQDALLFLGVTAHGFFFTAHIWDIPYLQQSNRMALVPPAWSLSLEVLFYAFAPYLVRLRSGWLVAGLVATFALRLAAMPYVPLKADPWSYRFFPFEVGTFLVGILAYRLYRRAPAWRPSPTVGRLTAAAAIAALMVLAGLRLAIFWAPLTLIVAVPILFAATRWDRLDRMVGELSYPVYLVHWPVYAILQGYRVPHGKHVAVVVTVLVSIALVRWIDVPVDRLRQRLAARFGGAGEGGALPVGGEVVSGATG